MTEELKGESPSEPESAPPSRSRDFAMRPIRWLNQRLGGYTTMILVAVGIGLAGGLGAVFFRWLIGEFQNLSWGYGGTPLDKIVRSPWYWRIIVPAAGGLLVGLIVKYLAPEAKGHGVPEVMYATARLRGVIRPVVALAKSFASAICIASGGAVGREGPIVQIGSALGSTTGQLLHMSTARMRICVGCGAAAGIAATFNAPIAGAFFAAEVILGGFSAAAFGPIVISSVAATVVSRSILGDVPAFAIPEYALVYPAEMITYVVLGVLAALVAVSFIKILYWSEELFDRLKVVPGFLQPVIGGVGVGCLGVALPQIMGVGYDTISGALTANLPVGILLAVLGAKLLATTLTLGSGGSGGVFAPSLFIGAALGGAVGYGAQHVLPFPMASPGAYAVVGMGAMVAAATHAPITAILIIFELTGDYRVILALMVSCILGHLIAQRMMGDSIYTIKLARRGIDLREGQEVNVLRRVRVRDILRPEVETVPRSATLDELYRFMVESPHYELFTVDDDGNLLGVVSVDDIRRTLPDREELRHVAVAEDLTSSPVIYVREDDTLDTAMRQFGKRTYEELPVLPAGEAMVPIGTIQRQDVIVAYNKEILKVDLPGSVSASIETAARLKTWETLGGHVLAHIEAPAHLCGRELKSLKLRQHHRVQIILIERAAAEGEDRFAFPTPESILQPGDRVIIFGQREDVQRLARESE